MGFRVVGFGFGVRISGLGFRVVGLGLGVSGFMLQPSAGPVEKPGSDRDYAIAVAGRLLTH